MSGTQGSETRQRHHDVRIRLRDEDELKQLDVLATKHGFHGHTARGDLIRSLLLGVAIPPTPAAPSRQRSPARQHLSTLDRLARELQKLLDLIIRMEKGVLPPNDLDRLRTTLPTTIEKAVNDAALVLERLSVEQAEDEL
jgi:hypothetical protein